MATSGPPAAECLGVILDLSQSHAQMPKEQLSSLLDQTLFFLNAYSLLSSSNQLLVFAPHASGVQCLWPPAEAGPDVVAAPSNPPALRAAFLAGVESVAECWTSQERKNAAASSASDVAARWRRCARSSPCK